MEKKRKDEAVEETPVVYRTIGVTVGALSRIRMCDCCLMNVGWSDEWGGERLCQRCRVGAEVAYSRYRHGESRRCWSCQGPMNLAEFEGDPTGLPKVMVHCGLCSEFGRELSRAVDRALALLDYGDPDEV